MRRTESEIIIEAPAQAVWDAITDLDRYPEWNRFTPRISLATADLAVGAELDLDCQMTETELLRDEREVILALEPERFALCMGTSRTRGRPGIRSQRWQVCLPLGAHRTRFINHEEFSGPLAPLVHLLYTRKLRRAFEGYCQDLRRRVERSGHGLAGCFLHRDSLVRFVRQTLGCSCPDTIFDDVQLGYPALALTGQSSAAVPGGVELLLGHRLLVSIVPVSALEQVARVSDLLRQGRQTRDDHGLNRYRLVLVGRLSPTVRSALEALPLPERTHLHFIRTL